MLSEITTILVASVHRPIIKVGRLGQSHSFIYHFPFALVCARNLIAGLWVTRKLMQLLRKEVGYLYSALGPDAIFIFLHRQ